MAKFAKRWTSEKREFSTDDVEEQGSGLYQWSESDHRWVRIEAHGHVTVTGRILSPDDSFTVEWDNVQTRLAEEARRRFKTLHGSMTANTDAVKQFADAVAKATLNDEEVDTEELGYIPGCWCCDPNVSQ